MYTYRHRGKCAVPRSNAQPTIFTQHDLLAFHSRVYGKPFTSSTRATVLDHLISGSCAFGRAEGDEDMLGHYEDGTKRTLTDEQIAMFRHTEIQTILQTQRQQRDSQRSGDETDSCSQQLEKTDVGKDNAHSTESIGCDEIIDEITDEEDDEEEYATFLKKERREMELAAVERQKKSHHSDFDDSRKTSTRRKVRELDAVTGGDDVLDYDDESPTTADFTSPETPVLVDRIGKKIWWPEISLSQ